MTVSNFPGHPLRDVLGALPPDQLVQIGAYVGYFYTGSAVKFLENACFRRASRGSDDFYSRLLPLQSREVLEAFWSSADARILNIIIDGPEAAYSGPPLKNRKPIVLDQDGARKLADAIVMQAAQDYKRAYKRIFLCHNKGQEPSAKDTHDLHSAERFILSESFEALTDCDGHKFLQALRESATQMRKSVRR